MKQSEYKSDYDRRLEDLESKLSYYLMAAVATGFGLMVNQISEMTIWLGQLPLVFCCATWMFSFWFGYKHLKSLSESLQQRIAVLTQKELRQHLANHENIGELVLTDQIRDGIADQLKKDLSPKDFNRKAQYDFREWQVLLFGCGAGCYLLWQFIELLGRSWGEC